MSAPQAAGWTRRAFLGRLTLAGVTGLFGLHSRPAGSEPPPEMTTLKLIETGGACLAPQYVAEALLQSEGFAEVHYVKKGCIQANQALASGEVHLTMGFVGNSILQIDAGDPIVILSGVHVGCYALFAVDPIRAIRDLKGKRVAVTELGSGRHTFFASVLAYVGMDPRTDVHFVPYASPEAMRLFTEGTIDAYVPFAEEVPELRARQVGHVILDSALDRPWSQYFCCTVAGNREFVQKHPVATKRALRAILKAANICASTQSGPPDSWWTRATPGALTMPSRC